MKIIRENIFFLSILKRKLRMSYTNQEFNKKDVPVDFVQSGLSSSAGSLMNNSASLSSNDSVQSALGNKRVVKSCLWSTTIFSINFVSSILVINLAKW